MTNSFTFPRVLSLCFFLFSGSFFSVIHSQQIVVKDNAIAEAVSQISSDNMRVYVEELVSFHNRNNLSSVTDPKRGVGAASTYIFDKVQQWATESQGRMSVEKVFYRTGGPKTRLGREVELSNVVATIEGRNNRGDRMVVVLAHYDSRSQDGNDSLIYAPGANDNGSGVACMLEMARILSKIDMPGIVKLIFLSGEEHGLLGAQYMSDLAKKEGWNIVAVMNNDMIGNSNASETNYQTNMVVRVFSENIPVVEDERMKRVRVYNSMENDSPSRQLARYIKEIGERYVENHTVKLIYRNDRFGRGGDHTPFCRNGFTAVRICEVNENYDRTHQKVYKGDNGILYGDEIWAVDFEYVRKNTGVNLSTAMNLLFSPPAPRNVVLNTSGLSNSTFLKWEAPEGEVEPCGYYVLIRETDQSNWERKIFTTEKSITIPLSKDNYFFAVQSVGKGWNESLAVFAEGRSN